MLLAQRHMIRISKCLEALPHRMCTTSAMPERNSTGRMNTGSNDFKLAISRHKEYFNKDNPMETIKEEFQMEMQDMQRFGSSINMPPHEIYQNIGRISARLEDLDANHQTFSDIHNAVTRAIKHSNQKLRKQEEETIDYVQDSFAEINGKRDSILDGLRADTIIGNKEESVKLKSSGTYGAATFYGKRLISQYHQVMSNQYRIRNEQLVRPKSDQ